MENAAADPRFAPEARLTLTPVDPQIIGILACGTVGGTGILIGLAGLAIAALALVPFLGYLEALALPALAARARRREPERYAGLRTLARD